MDAENTARTADADMKTAVRQIWSLLCQYDDLRVCDVYQAAAIAASCHGMESLQRCAPTLSMITHMALEACEQNVHGVVPRQAAAPAVDGGSSWRTVWDQLRATSFDPDPRMQGYIDASLDAMVSWWDRMELQRVVDDSTLGLTPLLRLHFFGMLHCMGFRPLRLDVDMDRLQGVLLFIFEQQAIVFESADITQTSSDVQVDEERLRALAKRVVQAGELLTSLAEHAQVATPELTAWLQGLAISTRSRARIGLNLPGLLASHPFALDGMEIDDISYKYMPVSVFDVRRQGLTKIRGTQSTKRSSRETFSPFPTDVAEWMVGYFLREKWNLFDPFAGWGERHRAAMDARKFYIGFDTSPGAIQYGIRNWGVQNMLMDSRTARIPEHDGILSCPPYWDVEAYQGPGLQQLPTWEAFLEDYRKVWRRAVAAAKNGARYCVVVADWRKQGVYYDLTYATECILQDCGMKCFDKVVLSYKRQAPLKAMVHQAKRLGYSMKVHQTLLVYDKPMA